MRLLHTSRLTIEMVDERATPRVKYAILSHTWEDEEVTFQEMQNIQPDTKRKKGYDKILKSCDRAKKGGFDWIWIDTCCIDKTSSAELSEAINSMFRYYDESAVCYAFLSDAGGTQPIYCDNDPDNVMGRVTPRWYSRGWTLQELITPRKVHFLNKHWEDIGTKEDHRPAIAPVSGIDEYALVGEDVSRITVARRMMWFAKRRTTRVEDIAYCMLGVFGVNMPLLYGEGHNAFGRLQEEIVKSINDQSIFVWMYPNPARLSFAEHGLLAKSPSSFQSAGAVSMFINERPERPQPVVTRHGLGIQLLMCKDPASPSRNRFIAVLDCQAGTTPGVLHGIYLEEISSGVQRFRRMMSDWDFPFGLPAVHFARKDSSGNISLQGFNPTKPQDELVKIGPSKLTSRENSTFCQLRFLSLL
jgi:hypothetical protein